MNGKYSAFLGIFFLFLILFSGTASALTWFDTDFLCKQQADLNMSSAGSVHVDVPIKLNINPGTFWTLPGCSFESAGEDFRPVNADESQQLDYYFEGSWTATDANIIVELHDYNGDDASDYFWIYGSNSGASDAQDPNAVYDSNYILAYQLDDASAPVDDKTSNGNDGAENGGTIVYQDADKIPIGLGTLHDAANESFNTQATLTDGFASGTIIWTGTAKGDAGYLWGHSDVGGTENFYAIYNNNGNIRFSNKTSNTERWFFGATVGRNNYQQLAFTWGSEGAAFYENGNQLNTDADTTAASATGTDFWVIGTKNLDAGNIADGTHDEFVIMNETYSEDFFELYWDSHSNTLITGFSGEESYITIPDINILKIDGSADDEPLPSYSAINDGNLTIDFNVQDDGNDRLTVDLNFSSRNVQGTGVIIVDDLNLTSEYCDDEDFSNTTSCSWDFNIDPVLITTGDGNYYILASVSDGTNTDFNASDGNFLIDNTAPSIFFDNFSSGDSASGDFTIFVTITDLNSDVDSDFTFVDSNSIACFPDKNLSSAESFDFEFFTTAAGCPGKFDIILTVRTRDSLKNDANESLLLIVDNVIPPDIVPFGSARLPAAIFIDIGVSLLLAVMTLGSLFVLLLIIRHFRSK